MAKNKPLPPLSNPKPGEMITLPNVLRFETQPAHDHCSKFCVANDTSFDLLAMAMQSERWELVSVVPFRKYVTTGGGNGYSDGWMTFWKRIRMSKNDKRE